MAKFIFVTGGVVSGLGKGITAASLGRLLKSRGIKVAAQKLDPYMNIDPGQMCPLQHGEVFVTDDGAETDLDLGHYERFIDEDLNKYSNLTSGRVYWTVLTKERNGDYHGDTVQVIPHVTNEVKSFIYASAKSTKADVVITEIGGTIGDIESQPFIEAIRQVATEVGRKNCLFVHVTLVPFISGSNEHKSKPTQHSVKQLQELGLSPDIIITRSDEPIGEGIMKKISLFCNVKQDCVIENITVDCLYEAPLMLHKGGLDRVVCRELRLKSNEPDLKAWEQLVERIKNPEREIKIALVGKYVKLHDAYLSVVEAIYHAGYALSTKISIVWLDSAELKDANVEASLKNVDGILIPDGFGAEGTMGKILAIKYARENDIPLFGICFGMQMMVIEFARNVAGITDADSKEFSKKGKNLVIDLLPEYRNKPANSKRRLGRFPCQIKEGTLMKRAYREELISERHCHRYEFNNDFKDVLEKSGLTISGTSPDGEIVETVELTDKKFFIGVQFHPEFKSRPNRAHPLFFEFIKASIDK